MVSSDLQKQEHGRKAGERENMQTGVNFSSFLLDYHVISNSFQAATL